MTIEKLVPEIIHELRTVVWPKSRKAGVIISDETDACGEWFHPLWLAQMVVGIVEEKALKLKCIHLLETGEAETEHEAIRLSYSDSHCRSLNWWIINRTLRDFSLTPKDWTWLKERIKT